MPRFSANLGFLFCERPFAERFGAAAAAGFSAVEFADAYTLPVSELRRNLDDHGLDCVLINLPMGDASRGDKGIACLPDRRAEFRQGLALGIERALALGCPRVNCMAGRQPPDGRLDPRQLRSTLVENLSLAAAEAAKAGLKVNLEPLNTVEVPGYLVSGSADALSVIEEVGASNLQLQYDVYHLAMMGEADLSGGIERLAGRIGHIQIADIPGRHEPGHGRLQFPEIFSAIDRSGYQGWVGAEYRPSARTEDTLAWRLSPTLSPSGGR